MGRNLDANLDVLVRSDGADASFVEMVLGLHAGVAVRREDDGGDHDAVVLCVESPPLSFSSDLPLIVVARWAPTAHEMESMVRDGADDVIPFAELSGARLEAAVRKAVGRRTRVPHMPLTPHVPVTPLLGSFSRTHGPLGVHSFMGDGDEAWSPMPT